eukprot:15042179-Alexandrium_andersonii.AAC.1
MKFSATPKSTPYPVKAKCLRARRTGHQAWHGRSSTRLFPRAQIRSSPRRRYTAPPTGQEQP